MEDFEANITFAPAFEDLFKPNRYKVYYGGRGSAKSWSFARALICIALQRKVRILCARELQTSITDSVYKLLSDQIHEMGFGQYFEVLQSSIRCTVTGSEFAFAGLRTSTVTKIKSFEGVDFCWVEEAQTVSKKSWDILIPTIRKEVKDDKGNIISQSEIWVSFNPDLEEDDTYLRFVKKPPGNAIVKMVSWRDNPWFPEVLRKEKDELMEKDYDAYMNVWEGHCKVILDGAVYAEEIRQLIMDKRITNVPWDRSTAVHTFWDLGWADSTSIWFAQQVGFDIRIIDYYTNSQKPIQHYLDVLQKKQYIYGTDWLPHDAKAKDLRTGMTIEEICKKSGRNVRIVPKLSLNDGINAVRTIIPNCWFDEEKCSEGLKALKHYRYEVDETADKEHKQFSKVPVHDWSSHGADSFRYLALSIGRSGHKQKGHVQPAPPQSARSFFGLRGKSYNREPGTSGLGWMK
jgi:phage terminase large subunit